MEPPVPQTLKMVIFDLDETLHHNKTQDMPRNVKDILNYFRSKNVIIALASLNSCAAVQLYMHKMIHVFDDIETRQCREQCMTAAEVDEYNSLQKSKMFERLLSRHNVAPEEVLLFDDVWINIMDAKQMKIKAIMVNAKTLITWRDVRTGFNLFKTKPHKRYSLDW